ncbi:MAG: hypothetical protein JOY57_02135 [Actinobacteria bacterium]|nr:hypothetical protein [Actinomycetota bacterium]
MAAAQADPATKATITLDRNVVRPGENIIVQFHNWKARAVTLSVCGNLASRGSADCDLVGSQGVPMSRFSPETVTAFAVTAPPTTCPCVLRASDSLQTEIAYASITLLGVAVGPVVSPADFSAVTLTMKVARVKRGAGAAVRSSLGGPTTYVVTVVVRNTSVESLTGVRLYGRAGRSQTDQTRTLEFPAVPSIGAGQSWTHRVEVRTPAPHLGRFYWEVSVSGGGRPIHVESVTRDTPWLLILMVAIVVGDLAMMLARRIKRRGLRRRLEIDDQTAVSAMSESGVAGELTIALM